MLSREYIISQLKNRDVKIKDVAEATGLSRQSLSFFVKGSDMKHLNFIKLSKYFEDKEKK